MPQLTGKLTLLLLLTLTLLACRKTVEPSPVKNSEEKVPVVTAKTSPDREWNKLVAEAKKEGRIIIGTSNASTVRDPLSRAFKDKYGVDLEFIAGPAGQLVPKLQTERRAGIYNWDMLVVGAGSAVPILGPAGVLEPLDSVLQLPEVVDKKSWWGGDLQWIGPEHLGVMFLAFPSHSLWVNSDMVRTGEIKSYYDLLNPKWKGKITFRDPTVPGAGSGFFTYIIETLPEGLDYLRELGKQAPVFIQDPRIHAEWVARGKYPVAIGVKRESATEFIDLGLPIRYNPAVEGTYLTGEGGGVALINRAPHPKAAVLFINWLLSKEGQIIASQAFGGQSAREDIPTGRLKPYEMREPGVKYHNQINDLGLELRKIEHRKMANQLYGHLLGK